MRTNETHDASIASWVNSAGQHSEFPLQNLPLGIFRRRGTRELPRVGVAIGSEILDLGAAAEQGWLRDVDKGTQQGLRATNLNGLMALNASSRAALRLALHRTLRGDAPRPLQQNAERCLVAQAEAEMFLPARIGDYTDFYASLHHATNVGRLFRPDNPLLPNYKHMPIAYHGRSSSLVISGTPVTRPRGQQRVGESDPVFGPSRRLDYELEVGMFVAEGNALGSSIAVDKAESHLFGFCLVNDWSARDIQAWEYQPLGPFLGKNFATTVSPWVVTTEALAPFRVPAQARAAGDPTPLAYLLSAQDQAHGGVDVQLEVWLATPRMREERAPAFRLSAANFRSMYWTPAQMVAHHTCNGCNLQPGDLLASGTVSGEARDSWGSLLEITRSGREPVVLPNGESRTFLEEGDEVVLRGACAAPGLARIGWGEARGMIVAARG
jgi:fumarylacetoacetase